MVAHFKFAYVGDTHGHIENMPRLIELFHQYQHQFPELISVFTGDFVGTTIESLHSQGQLDVKLINQIFNEQAIATLGNHDFDYGENSVVQFIHELQANVVVSNLKYNPGSPLQSLIRNYYLLKKGNQHLVFFGALPYEMKTTSDQLRTIDIMDYKETIQHLKATMEQLQQQYQPLGYILLSHMGIDLDEILAQHIPNLLILGGHSHSVLPLKTFHAGRSAIAHAGSNGRYLGLVDAELTTAGWQGFHGELINVDEKLPKNEQARISISKETKQFELLTQTNLAEVILSLQSDKQRENFSLLGHPRFNDTFITRAMSDAMIEAISPHARDSGIISLFHGGGVRAALPTSTITVRDIHGIFPYPQYMVVTEITGAELLLALEIGVSMTNWRQRSGLLHPSSNLSYSYDVNLPRGFRIHDVTINNQPLVLDQKYEIVTNNWIAAGNENQQLFKDLWLREQFKKYPDLKHADMFIHYLKLNRDQLQHEFNERLAFGLRILASPSLLESESLTQLPAFRRGQEMPLQIDFNKFKELRMQNSKGKKSDDSATDDEKPGKDNPINPQEDTPPSNDQK